MKNHDMRRGPRGRGPAPDWAHEHGPAWARHEGFDGPPGRGHHGRRGGPGRGRGRGGRPRGDIRGAILMLLAEAPRHGYDLIRAIEERTEGTWVPSPGSVYPTLQALEDEGLVTVTTVDGRKTASLTEQGRAHVEQHAAEHEHVFDTDERTKADAALRREIGELRDAAIHIARRPDQPELTARAVEIIAAARKDLYRLLAD